MSSPRRLPLAAALATALALSAGASTASAITSTTTCPSGVSGNSVAISTAGTQPNPAKAGQLQLCGISPLSTTGGVAATKTVGNGSLPTNPSYTVITPFGNFSVPVFYLGKATIDWGDGSATTTNITPSLTGGISASHTYAAVTVPTAYQLTVSLGALYAPSGTSASRPAATGGPAQITEPITVNPQGPQFTITPGAANGTNGWRTSPPVTAHLSAADDDGLQPFSCTDALNSGAATGITPADTTPDGTFPTTREADISTSVEGVHHIVCVATDNSADHATTTKSADLKLDVTKPALTVNDWTTNANQPNGAFLVGYPTTAVKATDNLSGATATCVPSGFLITLPMGTTHVTCSVKDGAGNVGDPASFDVYVKNAVEQLDDLIVRVRQEAGVSALAVTIPLGNARAYAAAGKNDRACTMLTTAAGSAKYAPGLNVNAFNADALRIGLVLGCKAPSAPGTGGLPGFGVMSADDGTVASSDDSEALGAAIVEQLPSSTDVAVPVAVPRPALVKLGRMVAQSQALKAKAKAKTKRAHRAAKRHARAKRH